MTNRFHITAKGDIGVCRATKRACPVGGEHFENSNDARLYNKAKLKENNSIIPDSQTKNKLTELNTNSIEFNEEAYIKLSNSYIENLTLEEKSALEDYVISGYQEINAALYESNGDLNKIDSETQVKIKAIDSALNKYAGAPEVVWRNLSGNNLPKSFVAQDHKVGDTIDFHGFSSASETPSAMSGVWNLNTWYMEEVPAEERVYEKGSYRFKIPDSYRAKASNNVVFKIKTSSAAPVSMLRGRAAEQEFLIPRDKQFRITNIHKNVELKGSNMRGDTFANIYEIEEI